MKRFSQAIKWTVMMLSLFTFTYASARLQRMPEPGPAKPSAEKIELQKQQKSFLNFIQTMKDNHAPKLEGAGSPIQKQLRQLPDKILRTPWDPEGNLYVVVPNFYGIQSTSQAYWGRLYATEGSFQKIFQNAAFTNGEDAFLQAGFVRNDILYIPTMQMDALGMVTGEFGIIWKRVDIYTGQVLPSLSFGNDAKAMKMFTYGMTYDPNHDTVYGLIYDFATEGGGGLLKVDLSKPESEWKASSEEVFNLNTTTKDWMAGICYNPENDGLYGLTSGGRLCEIDTQNKAVITLREYDMDYEDFCFPPILQSTPMAYSPHDKAIIYSYGSTTAYYAPCAIDMQYDSYDPYVMATYNPLSMVSTIYCADAYAPDNAPGLMEAPVLNFPGNSLKGTFSFTAPTTTYEGLALEPATKMTLHVLVDEHEVFSTEVTPGQKVTDEIELTNAAHIFKGYCSLGDLKGPAVIKRIYTGNDQPYAPTNLKLANGVLTWTAPIKSGVNNAYLDLSNVTYDVYIDEEKVNNAPISGTTYNLVYDKPSDGRKYITVTATANGVTSEHSQGLGRVLGPGFSLPVSYTPTYAESTLFDSANVNRDNYAWEYESYTSNFTIRISDYTQSPDDWLFMPPVYLANEEDVYNLKVTYINAYGHPTQKDNLDICIGRDPLPEAMTQTIYSHEGRVQDTETDLDVNFVIDHPGTYFVGFHSKPGKETVYRGIDLRNFRLQKESGSSSLAPGDVKNVKLTPAEKGEPFITVDGTMPTVNMKGGALDADKDLNLNVYVDPASPRVITGKPGEKFNVTIPIGKDGYTDVYFWPFNEAGNGLRQVYTVYAGMDNALPPTNIQYTLSADNLSMNITWDPVGSVGQHGGYVDTDDIVYDMYSQNVNGSTKLGSAGKALSYTYKIQNVPQIHIFIGPVAVNDMGISTNGTFINETMGKLYNTPMNEEFGYSAFDLQKWLYTTTAPFNNVKWEHYTAADDYNTDITFGVGGAFRAYNEGGGINTGELRAPRLSTKTDSRVGVSIRYWDNPRAGKMELWGRTFKNQEFRKVAELDPARSSNKHWEDWLAILPDDFCEEDWIQVNVRAVLTGNQDVIIDNYNVIQVIDNDFQLTSISSPYSSFVGDTPQFDIVVTNNGAETSHGTLKLELLGDDRVLETQIVDIERLRSGQEYEHFAKFEMLESYVKHEYLELRATAMAEGDENVRNNEKSVDILLYDNAFPMVRDLKGERAENDDVTLTWSTPDNKQKGLESAEVYPSFGIYSSIGPWTNADIDGMEPFVISSKRWTRDNEPCAWTVFNADDMKTMDEPRLSPRSGKQMLLARSVAYDTADKPTRSMDFLISPEVKGGSKVSFWINALDSQYAETVAIFYSSTDMTLNPEDVDLTAQYSAPRKCGSFKWLKNFTKSGAETWEQCEFELPEDAKYFAFVYSSFGMFGAMIDDIIYEPVNPALIDIDSYDVFVAYNGETPSVVATEVPTTSYVLTSADPREATYYVKTNVMAGDRLMQSALSNPAKVEASSVEGLEAGQFISGGKGKITIGGAAGKAIAICDADGRVLRKTTLAYDPQVFAIDAGIYLVKLGDKTVKVVVR